MEYTFIIDNEEITVEYSRERNHLHIMGRKHNRAYVNKLFNYLDVDRNRGLFKSLVANAIMPVSSRTLEQFHELIRMYESKSKNTKSLSASNIYYLKLLNISEQDINRIKEVNV